MSDFKASFRAAAAQRGSSAPSKEQIRALKAQKAAEASRPGSQGAPTQAALASSGVVEAGGRAVPSAKGLPSDFFQTPAAAVKAQPAAAHLGPAAAPSAAALAKSAGAAGPKAALPTGFFADKAADAKARGEKLPDQKDKEEEFKQFQRLMDDQIKDIVTKEAEEAEEDAEAREEREAFEQRLRMQQLEALRQRRAAEGVEEGAASTAGRDGEEEAQRIALPPRKRKVSDFLREELGSTQGAGVSEGADDDDDDDDVDDEDLVLDWRAKGV